MHGPLNVKYGNMTVDMGRISFAFITRIYHDARFSECHIREYDCGHGPHLVGVYYKNISRCTVLWMSNTGIWLWTWAANITITLQFIIICFCSPVDVHKQNLNQSRLSSNFREPFSRGIPLRKQEPEGFRRVLFSCTCWLKQIWKHLHCSAVSAISRIGVGMAEVREMGWPCCDVIHLLWLQGLSGEGWVPPLWLSLRSELVHANNVTKWRGAGAGGLNRLGHAPDGNSISVSHSRHT